MVAKVVPSKEILLSNKSKSLNVIPGGGAILSAPNSKSTIISVPLRAIEKRSFPLPPIKRSSPSLATKVSFPSFPQSSSLPSLPITMSFPA